MKKYKIVSFIVYFIAAITLGLVAFESMMAGVWGVQISPLNYVAVFAAVALFFGSFVCLFNLLVGRIICGIALAALGTFYVPAIVSIVPAHNEIVPPIGYLIFLAYLGAMAFALFYPEKKKFSWPVLVIVLLGAGAFFGVTFTNRVTGGEYDRPAISFFIWKSGGSELQIEDDYDHWIKNETEALLKRNGIRGELKWNGSSGDPKQKNQVIILVKQQIISSKQIFYPRNGTVIYAFDGTNWLTIPQNISAYSTFATLDPFGSNTMFNERLADGAIQGSGAYFWK